MLPFVYLWPMVKSVVSGQRNNTEKQFIISIFFFLLGLKHLLVHNPVVVLKRNTVSSEITLQYCVSEKTAFFFFFFLNNQIQK